MAKKDTKVTPHTEISRAGGLAVKKKYGSSYYSKIAKKRHVAERKRKAAEKRAAAAKR
jgi:hypothetical protein